MVTALLAPTAAQAAPLGVGPVDPSTGVPFWVADGAGRLDLCLDGPPGCLTARSDLVAPDGEAFWFNAAAQVSVGGQLGLVEMATEAAFAGPGADQQIAFNRLRIRLDVDEPGTYEVRYPYGTKTYVVATVDPRRSEINDTQDVGCLAPPCGDFAGLADSGAGGVQDSFLRWDPAVGPAAPAGFLGDALTPHRVVGSPVGRNFVQVVRTHDAAGDPLAAPQTVGEEHLFAVQGKYARPAVVASPAGGSYQSAVSVSLVGSEPEAEVFYTTDGESPVAPDGTPAAGAVRADGPVPVEDDTVIRAVNVVAGAVVTDPVTGGPSTPSRDAYVIDATAPDLSATPADGTYASAQHVELIANDAKDPTPVVHYTVAQVAPGGEDPADPTVESRRYTGPVPVNGNTDGASTVLKAVAVDAAGNVSPVVRREYTILAPTASASPAGGSYTTAQDVELTASDADAAIYYTTDGTDPVVEQDPTTMEVTAVPHGTLYRNDPVHLTAMTTLKFVAVSTAGQSTVMSERYLIDIPENRGKGALAAVGPVDAAHGYPFWYGDKGDAAAGLDPVRLEICYDDPLCPVVSPLPDPSQPRSFPDNFPDEAFWWSGEAAMTTPSGASALLVMAQEAAFGATGEVAVGQQTAFSRLRIRIDDAAPGESYTVTTPYGVDVVTADDRGRARMTEDIGCLAAPCDFASALDGRVGPFLRWDPAEAPAAPAGYVGNPLVEHTVTGSPYGTNVFRIDGPDIGGPGVDTVQTDQFAVQGRVARLRATVSPQGGLYGEPQDVTIQASFPDESRIVYTTDGSVPTLNADGSLPDGVSQYVPATGDTRAAAVVAIPAGTTTLRFMAVDLDSGETSEVYTEEYTVQGALPTVSADPAPAAGPFQGKQSVTLSATVDGDPLASSRIYYTTDGTRPRVVDGEPVGATATFTGPITVNRPTTVTAMAVSDGVTGPVARFHFVVRNLQAAGPVDPANGFPTWYQEFGASPGEPGLRLDLCLDDPLCPVVGDLPDPGSPVTFPGNFPDEAFWWAGDAGFRVGAGRARLVLGVEAAFAGGPVRPGDQVGFGRVRVRVDGLVPGATYRVTHPYGVERLTAGPDGSIFHTDDTGCLAPPCTFAELLESPVGPFLRWDEGAPEGYVGDGATPHTVVGSPFDTNLFRLEQVTDRTGAALPAPALVGETDQFVVQGRIARLRATATPRGGAYTATQSVRLASNDPTATLHYTTDGSEPTADSSRYNGPIAIESEGTTTLRYLAIGADGAQSAPGTEVYTLDFTAPTVDASPAGGTFAAGQQVSLTSDDPTAEIHYTLDGSTPSAASPLYTEPVAVSRSLTLQARAFDPAGNAGLMGSWTFVIGLPASSLSLTTPTPTTLDAGATTSLRGRLVSSAVGLAGRQVVLQQRRVGTVAWVTVPDAVALTGPDGRYTFDAVRPAASSDLRVRFLGDASNQASTSPLQRVAVRAVLTVNPLVPTVARGRPVTYAGRLSPSHQGARITVTVSRTGQRSLTATATVSAAGTWSVTTRAPGRVGAWTVTARWGGDADHLAATSTPRVLSVVR
ncbi:MAG: chitobiase/beta-hexosaminidase C-terminal domain-containing protein [Nocardioidaceae bacterium]